jgi:hypothetical protein
MLSRRLLLIQSPLFQGRQNLHEPNPPARRVITNYRLEVKSPGGRGVVPQENAICLLTEGLSSLA